MIILDTNVVSEPMRRQPDAQVLRRLAAQDATTLFMRAITEAELRTGVEILPAGKCREALGTALEAMLAQDFEGRVLPFEGGATALANAAVQAERHVLGRPIATADASIAAIARARGMRLATRDVNDFVGTGVGVINPWV